MVEDLSMRIYNIEALLKVINSRITALESGHGSNEQTALEKELKRTVNQQAASMHSLYIKNQELEFKIKGDEESYRIQQRLLCECEYRVKELSQDNAALQTKLKFFQDTSVDLGESNNRLREENHKLKDEVERLENANCHYIDSIEKLQREYSDLRLRFDNQPLVEKQTALTCLYIVSKIKNYYSGPGYITVFDKIESGIKKEFDLK